MATLTLDNLISISTLIVTGGGFLLWYLVFLLQAKTLESQQEITKISLNKFLYDIRPNFILINEFSFYKDAGTPSSHDEVHYQVCLEKNVASNFHIEVKSDFLMNVKDLKESHENVQINERFDLIYKDFHRNDMNKDVDVYLCFTDEIGTAYRQHLSGTLYELKLAPAIRVSSL